MSTHPVESGRSERRAATAAERRKLNFKRHFTRPGRSPYDEVVWETRSAVINDEKGRPVFEQHDIEVPVSWSQTATNIVASKYFRGQMGTPERENSVRGLIGRVADTIVGWAKAQGYFATAEDLQAFSDELTHLLLEQKAAFNSPVWFNVGVEARPQGSACFINSVHDTMESILGLAKTEGMLFKFGSGTGTDLSTHPLLEGEPRRRRHRLGPAVVHARLRRSRRRHQERRQDPPRRQDGHPQGRPSRHRGVHRVQGRGRAQGLGADRGRLRRRLQRRGGAYSSMFFQNANHSVRVTDDFMQRGGRGQAVADALRPQGARRPRPSRPAS